MHLVVHDFGGPFGLLWGLQHPDAWASVVLINIGIMPGYTWHTMARRWRTPVLGELTQAWIPRSAWRRGDAEGQPERPARRSSWTRCTTTTIAPRGAPC